MQLYTWEKIYYAYLDYVSVTVAANDEAEARSKVREALVGKYAPALEEFENSTPEVTPLSGAVLVQDCAD